MFSVGDVIVANNIILATLVKFTVASVFVPVAVIKDCFVSPIFIELF